MLAIKSTTYDQRLEKNWKWCNEYFYRKTKQFGLEPWVLGMDNAQKRLGVCDYNRKKISVSSHLLRGPTCDEKKMRNTILHELAHALVGPNHSHDAVWKKMALKIGCDGSVCSPMDPPDAKYILECKNKCFAHPYYRRPKITNKVCMKCGSPPILKLLK